MSSFATFLVGFVILVVGLALAAYLLAVPPQWILVGVIVLVGIGVLMATSQTKPRDPQITTHSTRVTTDEPRGTPVVREDVGGTHVIARDEAGGRVVREDPDGTTRVREPRREEL